MYLFFLNKVILSIIFVVKELPMIYSLETYFLLFMIYSILGWCMESIKMIFNKNIGHFVDRGFLIGPYLPIYRLSVLLQLPCSLVNILMIFQLYFAFQ